jgi:transmembrane sensor
MTMAQEHIAGSIDTAILEEAADWMVRLHSGSATSQDRMAVDGWRARSAVHEQAWQRAQAFLGSFRELPADIARGALGRPNTRRQMLTKLAAFAAATPVAWVAWKETPWREWQADYRTAVGEQRTIRLAEGTLLILNTATTVDIDYSSTRRLVRLQAGEILIETAVDDAAAYRPFIVQTTAGEIQALGTRFTVRHEKQDTHVAVFEGAVEVRPAAGASSLRVAAGEQVRFSAEVLGLSSPVQETATSWRNGMLIVRQMRLEELVAELGRYRPGILRCDPQVADLRVSGAFPVLDSERSLTLLQDTFPLRLEAFTRYWVTLRARGEAKGDTKA